MQEAKEPATKETPAVKKKRGLVNIKSFMLCFLLAGKLGHMKALSHEQIFVRKPVLVSPGAPDASALVPETEGMPCIGSQLVVFFN